MFKRALQVLFSRHCSRLILGLIWQRFSVMTSSGSLVIASRLGRYVASGLYDITRHNTRVAHTSHAGVARATAVQNKAALRRLEWGLARCWYAEIVPIKPSPRALSLIFRFRFVSLPPGFVSLLLHSTLHFHWHLHSAYLCHLSEI